jgi:hypothetical protein
MSTLGLFYLANVSYGGFVSYTTHLMHALRAEGHLPMLFRIRARSESKERPFANGVSYRNVSLAEAEGIAAGIPSVVTCAYWKQFKGALPTLFRAGAACVLHDPTELHKDLVAELLARKTRVVCIRRGNQQRFSAQGLAASFARHPYVRAPAVEPQPPRAANAVSLSRIDFDKNTLEIVRANQLLPTDRQVQLHGSVNRMYTHFKVEPEHPGWEQYYRGTFAKTPTAAVEIARGARYVVDLSLISGDGGGTQYTFLEAWDAEAALLVHRGWLRPGEDLKEGENCIAAADAAELAALLQQEPPAQLRAGASVALLAHAPKETVPSFLGAAFQ